MADFVLALMGEAKGRATASFMNWAEAQPWWKDLDKVDQRAFRDRFYGSQAILTDFLRDVIKVSGQEERNEDVVRILAEISANQQYILKRLET